MTKTIWKLPLEQLTGVWVADTAPSDETNLWYKLDGTTGHPIGMYFYDTGLAQWVRPHAIPPLGKERMLWVGTPAELWSYDGGNGVDPSSTLPTISTGPFWEVDGDFSDKLAGGVGSTVAAVGTNYDILGSGAGGVNVRGVYLAKRTSRNLYTG